MIEAGYPRAARASLGLQAGGRGGQIHSRDFATKNVVGAISAIAMTMT